MHPSDAELIGQLKTRGLRPTRQRLALARLLFANGPRHVSAEELFQEAREAGIPVSLATVYNTLHQFTRAGLLSEVVVGSGQSYFDTNTTSHCHWYDRTTGRIVDIPEHEIAFARLPAPPEGCVVERIDVVIRIRRLGRSTIRRPAAAD
jgi:Fur family iron response transcriptional regulator